MEERLHISPKHIYWAILKTPNVILTVAAALAIDFNTIVQRLSVILLAKALLCNDVPNNAHHVINEITQQYIDVRRF